MLDGWFLNVHLGLRETRCDRRKPGYIIEHAKKCGDFDFHGSIDSREANRWLKATEKAFNTLELTEAQKVSNVYGLLHDTSDAWFARVRML